MKLSPLHVIILSFVILIFLGSLLIFFGGTPISALDAVFTATSAVCVTGLSVVDTAKLTPYQQSVILVLIQLGGLGFMTFSIGFFSLLTEKITTRWQFAFKGIFGETSRIPIRQVVKKALLFTVIIEAVSAMLLFFCFLGHHTPGRALYYALYHAISAFCNAGFSTYSDSFIGYATDPAVLLIISLTIILGGIGFIVLSEFTSREFAQNRYRLSRLSLHTKCVLSATLVLLIGGTFLIAWGLWDNTLGHLSWPDRIINAFFMSVNCRTAGFTSIASEKIGEGTLFIMSVLMFIGGSPGSIAGGIKTTTAWALVALIWSTMKKMRQTVIFKRALNKEVIERSAVLTILSILVVIIFTIIMHRYGTKNYESFTRNFFETVSAFGTVGLSCGISAVLTESGKIALSLMMLIGRLGPLTLLTALTIGEREKRLLYPDDFIMIG